MEATKAGNPLAATVSGEDCYGVSCCRAVAEAVAEAIHHGVEAPLGAAALVVSEASAAVTSVVAAEARNGKKLRESA